MGHEVCGVDISATKVGMINEGVAPLREKGIERLVRQVVRAGRFHASLQAADAMAGAGVSLVCVGTPSGRAARPTSSTWFAPKGNRQSAAASPGSSHRSRAEHRSPRDHGTTRDSGART